MKNNVFGHCKISNTGILFSNSKNIRVKYNTCVHKTQLGLFQGSYMPNKAQLRHVPLATSPFQIKQIRELFNEYGVQPVVLTSMKHVRFYHFGNDIELDVD